MIDSENQHNGMTLQAIGLCKYLTIEAFPYILAMCVLLVSRHAIGDLVGRLIRTFSG